MSSRASRETGRIEDALRRGLRREPDEVGQARPLGQRHRRSQTRTRHEIGVVKDRGDGGETMRNSVG